MKATLRGRGGLKGWFLVSCFWFLDVGRSLCRLSFVFCPLPPAKRSAHSHAKNSPQANVTPIARVTAKSVNDSIPSPANDVRKAKNTVRRTCGEDELRLKIA